MADLPKAERQLVANARKAFTHMLGLEAGDKLADELYEVRLARFKAKEPPNA